MSDHKMLPKDGDLKSFIQIRTEISYYNNNDEQ